MRVGQLPLPEDRQWVASTRRHHRTGARVLMAVLSEREHRNVHYRDFFAFGTTEFLEPELDILEMIDSYEKSANVRYDICFNMSFRIITMTCTRIGNL